MLSPEQEKEIVKENWNFRVDTSQSYVRREHHAILIKSIYKQQINSVPYLYTDVNRYEISNCFLALYCAKKFIDTNYSTLNLYHQYCKVCTHSHQALHLQAWGKELEQRILDRGGTFEYRLDYFEPVEWRTIFKKVSSHCISYGRHWLPHARREQIGLNKK